MKSPITGKEMKRIESIEDSKDYLITVTYKGEEYTIPHPYWLCQDTGETFHSTEDSQFAHDNLIQQWKRKYQKE